MKESENLPLPKIVILCGSLKSSSYNLRLAKYLETHFTKGISRVMTLHDIPLFNPDLILNGHIFPPSVQALRETLSWVRGLLLISPEYNHAVSGVLKNTIDWLSIGPLSPLLGLKVGLGGASTGPYGTARAQVQQRTICSTLGMVVMPKRELLVSFADKKIDETGKCLDEELASGVEVFCQSFQKFIGLE